MSAPNLNAYLTTALRAHLLDMPGGATVMQLCTLTGASHKCITKSVRRSLITGDVAALLRHRSSVYFATAELLEAVVGELPQDARVAGEIEGAVEEGRGHAREVPHGGQRGPAGQITGRHALEETIDGLDCASGPPHVLLARTVFGNGVSFMESRIKWHYMPMSDDEFAQAVAEIDRI